MTLYITRHRVIHGEIGKPVLELEPGAEFEIDDSTDEGKATVAHLRDHFAIALPVELKAPEEIHAQLAQLAADKKALEEKLAALEAAHEEPLVATFDGTTQQAASSKASGSRK